MGGASARSTSSSRRARTRPGQGGTPRWKWTHRLFLRRWVGATATTGARSIPSRQHRKRLRISALEMRLRTRRRSTSSYQMSSPGLKAVLTASHCLCLQRHFRRASNETTRARHPTLRLDFGFQLANSFSFCNMVPIRFFVFFFANTTVLLVLYFGFAFILIYITQNLYSSRKVRHSCAPKRS